MRCMFYRSSLTKWVFALALLGGIGPTSSACFGQTVFQSGALRQKAKDKTGTQTIKNPFYESVPTVNQSSQESDAEQVVTRPSETSANQKTYVARSIESIELRDEKRNKELMIRVTYPDAKGPFPVIVWSHGMYGSKDNYQPLIRPWVESGFVVIQPTHSDSLSLLSRSEAVKTVALKRLNNTDDWESRPFDVQFVLDSLSLIEKREPLLKGKMDTAKIGVGGHSFGAVTTQLLAGTAPRQTRQSLGKEFSDDRPRAFIAISPNGAGPFFSVSAFSRIEKPILFISGDNDTGRNGEASKWRRDPFDYANGRDTNEHDKLQTGEKFLAWIKGAHHNFGGISGASTNGKRQTLIRQGDENPEHVRLVVESSLTFWKAYLKDDVEAKKFLASDDLASCAEKGMTWESK